MSDRHTTKRVNVQLPAPRSQVNRWCSVLREKESLGAFVIEACEAELARREKERDNDD